MTTAGGAVNLTSRSIYVELAGGSLDRHLLGTVGLLPQHLERASAGQMPLGLERVVGGGMGLRLEQLHPRFGAQSSCPRASHRGT